MRERWQRIGLLAAALIVINVVGRLVVRIGSLDAPDTQQRIAVAAFAVTAVVAAVVAWRWGRLRPLGPVVGELAAALLGALVVILLIGPFVSGTTPAAVGAGDSFEIAWQYAGFAGGGALVGLLLLIMIGRDYRSQSLKRFAEEKLTRPRRPVRR